MQSDNFILHIASNASLDIYKDNNPSAFTNYLYNQINLDSNNEYEIGLINIAMPPNHYSLVKNEKDSNIIIYYSENNKEKKKIGEYFPQRNILSGDLPNLIKCLNNEFPEFFFSPVNSLDIPIKDIFSYSSELNRVGYLKRYIGGDTVKGTFYIKYGSRIADALGMDPNKYYDIVSKSRFHGSEETVWGELPPFSNAGIQYTLIYTDIVEPSYFGERNVNILDVVSVGRDGNTGFHTTCYKKLHKLVLEDISIKITDQQGRPVYFPERSNVICTLHIRKRYKY